MSCGQPGDLRHYEPRQYEDPQSVARQGTQGKINKKEIPQPQNQEGIKHRRQSLYLRPDIGEREGE